MADDIDVATVEAIVALELQDVDDFHRLQPSQDLSTDARLALRLHQSEVESHAATLQNRRLTDRSPATNNPLPDLPHNILPVCYPQLSDPSSSVEEIVQINHRSGSEETSDIRNEDAAQRVAEIADVEGDEDVNTEENPIISADVNSEKNVPRITLIDPCLLGAIMRTGIGLSPLPTFTRSVLRGLGHLFPL
ncbi:MAG: hypothetical protein Q9224_006105, partial [Gallowayella concinna]